MTAPPGGGPPTSADQVLQGLDPEQLAVAAAPTGPMCVLAGAGTGKTRAITHRIAYGVWSGAFQPHQVLAVTFTARAAGEMRTRLRALGVPGVQARTFHAAALRQLQYFWPQAVGGAPPEVIAQKAPAVAEAAGRLRLRLDRPALRDLAAEIEWAKVNLITPQGYPEAVRGRRDGVAGLDLTAVSRLMSTYEDVKGERHVIDFEDVLLLMVGILDAHPRIAGSVRDQYRHFVVDEYQDVNPVQQQLLDLWLGGREEICVVGDPAQTIYSFTGASPKHLLEFPQRHPDAKVVRLVRNYRSSPQIVQVANLVLGKTASGGVELRAQNEAGPAPQLTAYADDVAEAEGVAASIQDLLGTGTPASEVAVLFRTNAQSAAVESALAAREVPYLVRGGERFFSRQEVRQVQAQMAILGTEQADLACFMDGREFEVFRFERNDRFIAVMLAEVKEFYERLQNGDPPPVDGHPSTAAALAALHPDDNGETVTLPREAVDAAIALDLVKMRIKDLDAEKALHENVLKWAIGDATFGEAPGIRFSWKTQERAGYLKLADTADVRAALERSGVAYCESKGSKFRVLRALKAKA